MYARDKLYFFDIIKKNCVIRMINYNKIINELEKDSP